MDRRKFIKRVGLGSAAVGAAVAGPSLIAERWGPRGPEISDPRPPAFWEEDAGGFKGSGRLGQDLEVDVAVIGSGITGLSAAWTLKELDPALKIIVLDSHRPCSGASSRNSAHLLPVYNTWRNTLEKEGPEAARALNDFSRRGVEAVIDLFQRLGVHAGIHREPLVWTGTASQVKELKDLA